MLNEDNNSTFNRSTKILLLGAVIACLFALFTRSANAQYYYSSPYSPYSSYNPYSSYGSVHYSFPSHYMYTYPPYGGTYYRGSSRSSYRRPSYSRSRRSSYSRSRYSRDHYYNDRYSYGRGRDYGYYY